MALELAGNPVDLAQRKGQVHRYKGHAIRKNVAERFGDEIRVAWQEKPEDPWEILFELAKKEARQESQPELVPCWISEGSGKVQRCVPMLPFSKELEKLENLKQSLAIYRVVFGQPRQEELLTLLHKGGLTTEEIDSWVLRLSVE